MQLKIEKKTIGQPESTYNYKNLDDNEENMGKPYSSDLTELHDHGNRNMGQPGPSDTIIEKKKKRMGKLDELVDIKMIEGINWKTGKPNNPLNQISTPTSHLKNLEHKKTNTGKPKLTNKVLVTKEMNKLEIGVPNSTYDNREKISEQSNMVEPKERDGRH